VRVVYDTRKGALLVPEEAVTELQGNYQVAVVGDDNKANIRPVKVGQRFGGMWEITEGVKPGERVIVQGAQKVQEGTAVTAKLWTPPTQTPAATAADKPQQP
jgi:membrane fusion protein (multidrug efflux system)